MLAQDREKIERSGSRNWDKRRREEDDVEKTRWDERRLKISASGENLSTDFHALLELKYFVNKYFFLPFLALNDETGDDPESEET